MSNPQPHTFSFLTSKKLYLILAVFIAFVALYLLQGRPSTPGAAALTGGAPDSTVERIVTFSKSPVPFVVLGLDASDERLAGVNPETQITMDSHVLKRFFPRFPSISSKVCTKGFTPNIEEVLRLDPDLVLHWALFQDTIKQMRNFGLNVVGLEYDGTEETDRAIVNRIAAAIDREEKADSIMQWREQTLRRIMTITETIPPDERPTAIFFYTYEDLGVGGENTYEAFSIELVGGRNLANDMGLGRNINIEQLLEWDPDMIITGGWRTYPIPADIYPHPLLAEVSAIKNRRVYKMPVWASNEAVLIWEWMAEVLHPDAFDFNIREDIKKVHAWQYGIDLTDDDVDKMLFYDVNAISSGYAHFQR